MGEDAYTLIIVPSSSSHLHKLRLRLSALYAIGVVAVLVVGSGLALGVNYARMALRTAEYNQLVAENEALKIQNKNLELATRQLNVKIRGLEDLSGRIQQMMQTDTWNNRLGLLEAGGGVGGALDDYPTGAMLSNLSIRDNIELARGHTAELEGQLRFAERLVEQRADKLLITPSLWPVAGYIRSSYGSRRDPFTGRLAMHHGIDIGAVQGTPVRAPANGRVLVARRQAAYGNLIIVDHGSGLTTRYGHLARFATEAGALVEKGDIIGFVGSTGRSTGPHLHYEVRLHDRTINPRNYLPQQTVSVAD